MDKTHVMIKIPGGLYQEQNLLEVTTDGLEAKVIELLKTRKKLTNVSFKTAKKSSGEALETLMQVEIILADEHGNFQYYGD